MTDFTDDELYRRGAETLIASWGAYARGAAGASVRRMRGVAAALFPSGPERTVYNNALLERDLTSAARAEALDCVAAMYEAAKIEQFAVWVHESDTAMRHDLEQRGFEIDTSTRAMGCAIAHLDLPSPDLELGNLDWDDYLRRFDMPPGLLSNADLAGFTQLFACLAGEPVATALAFDHHGDCGIYNVATLEHARRRGLSTALTRLHLHRALERGCQTASLQATPVAERVYAAAGFRDLGRIVEYVPRGPATAKE